MSTAEPVRPPSRPRTPRQTLPPIQTNGATTATTPEPAATGTRRQSDIYHEAKASGTDTVSDLEVAFNAAHDRTRKSLIVSVKQLMDMSGQIQMRIEAEMGALQSTGAALNRQICKQLQDAHDKCVQSESTVKENERVLSSQRKNEAELKGQIDVLRAQLEQESKSRVRAQTILQKAQGEFRVDRETKEKLHTAALAKLAASHSSAIDDIKKAHAAEITRWSERVAKVEEDKASAIKALEKEIAAQKGELATLQNSITASQAQIQKLNEDSREQLRRQAAQDKAHAEELAALKVDFSTSAQRMTTELASSHDASLGEMRREHESAMKRAEDLHVLARKDIQVVQGKLDEAQTTIDRLQSDLKEAMRTHTAENQQHADELTRLREDHSKRLEAVSEDMAKNHTQRLTDTKNEHAEAISKLEAKLAGLEDKREAERKQASETHAQDLKQHEELLANAKADHRALEEIVASCNAEKMKLQEDLKDELRKQGISEKEHQAQLSDMKRQMEEATASHATAMEVLREKLESVHVNAVDVLKGEHAKIVAEHEEKHTSATRSLQEMNEEHKKRLDALHAERLADAKVHDEKLSATVLDLQTNHAAKVRELEIETVTLRSEHKNEMRYLQEKVDAAVKQREDNRVQDAATHREQLDAEKEQRKNEVATHKENARQLQVKLDASEAVIKKLQEELKAELRNKATTDKMLGEEAANLKTDLARSVEQCNSLKNEVQVAQESMRAAVAKANESEKTLKRQHEAVREKLERTIADRVKELEDLNQRFRDLEADKSLADRAQRLAADDATKHAKQGQDTKARLEKDLANTKEDFKAAMEQQRLEYETALEQQVAENETLYTKMADLQSQLKQAQISAQQVASPRRRASRGSTLRK